MISEFFTAVAACVQIYATAVMPELLEYRSQENRVKLLVIPWLVESDEEKELLYYVIRKSEQANTACSRVPVSEVEGKLVSFSRN